MSAKILAAEPQLFVSDLADALDFFVDGLGFSVGFAYGEPPFYAQVVRDGAAINLRRVGGLIFDAQMRARESDILSATLTVEGIEVLYDAYRARGVPLHQTLRAEPWGARTFIVRGPDANLIAFAGR